MHVANPREYRQATGTGPPHDRGRIAEERIWNKRPDGLAIKMPTTEKLGEFVILEFKRISDVTDQYVTLAKHVAEAQYASIKSALERTLRHSQAGIDSIRIKLAFKIFDEYANILKGMYGMRFNGRPSKNGAHDQRDPVPGGPRPPLITSVQASQPNNIRCPKEKEKKGDV